MVSVVQKRMLSTPPTFLSSIISLPAAESASKSLNAIHETQEPPKADNSTRHAPRTPRQPARWSPHLECVLPPDAPIPSYWSEVELRPSNTMYPLTNPAEEEQVSDPALDKLLDPDEFWMKIAAWRKDCAAIDQAKAEKTMEKAAAMKAGKHAEKQKVTPQQRVQREVKAEARIPVLLEEELAVHFDFSAAAVLGANASL